MVGSHWSSRFPIEHLFLASIFRMCVWAKSIEFSTAQTPAGRLFCIFTFFPTKINNEETEISFPVLFDTFHVSTPQSLWVMLSFDA